MSRTRRVLISLGARYLATGVSLVLALATTPILLRALGEARFGALRVGQEYLGYLGLLELGLGGVLMVGFARAFASGNGDESARVFRFGAGAFLRIGLLSAFGAAMLAIATPYLIKIPNPSERDDILGELALGFMIASVAVVWSPLAPLRYLVEAEQRGYVYQIGLIVQSVVTATAAVVAALWGWGLVGQFGAVTLGNAVATGVLFWDALRTRRVQIRLTVSTGHPPALPDRWRMLVFSLCSQVSVYSDTIIVGLTLGSAAVVPFTISQRLLLLVDAQILAIGASTWPALVELHHRGERDQMNHRLVYLTRLTAIFSIGLLIPAAALTREFVSLWVGPVGYGGMGLTLATLGWCLLHGLIALWAWPLMATGQVARVLPVMVVGALVNVPISFLATEQWGVVGPALGTLVNYLLVAIWWFPILLSQQFGTSLRELAFAVLGPLFLAGPFAFVALLAAAFPVDELPTAQWGRWTVLGIKYCVTAGLYFLLAWFLVLPREDRDELRSRLFGR